MITHTTTISILIHLIFSLCTDSEPHLNAPLKGTSAWLVYFLLIKFTTPCLVLTLLHCFFLFCRILTLLFLSLCFSFYTSLHPPFYCHKNLISIKAKEFNKCNTLMWDLIDNGPPQRAIWSKGMEHNILYNHNI